ncbi:MAG: carbonic anhydrase [Gemmataceae bacterium]
MQKLIEGIHQFQNESFVPLQGLFEQLAKGQKPETLFITCSDSRIDPTLLTQAQPGDLFILRNAGNIVPPHTSGASGEAATIEFAVTAIGVRDIIICGHSHCGAMVGLLHPEQIESMPAVCSWLAHADKTRQIIRENYSELDGERLLTATIEENVLVQLENLKSLPAVSARIERGDLHLHGWVYKIETGEVFAYDVSRAQFVKLADYNPSFGQNVSQRNTHNI